MLAQALSELEEKLRVLEGELSGIRRYVEILEQENATMQEVIKKKNVAVSGKNNLLNLFEAGFHVCPVHFGELRDGDCLFCMGFLDRDEMLPDDREL